MRVKFLVFRSLNEKLKDFFLCALCVSSDLLGRSSLERSPKRAVKIRSRYALFDEG
jgi:hypothetical protein